MPIDQKPSNQPDGYLPAYHRNALAALMARCRLSRDVGRSPPVADYDVLGKLVADEVSATCQRAIVLMAQRVARTGQHCQQSEPPNHASVMEEVRQAEEVLWQKIAARLDQHRFVRSLIFRLGRKRFGPPAPRHEATVAAVTDVARLEELADRLLDVTTWDELLPDA